MLFCCSITDTQRELVNLTGVAFTNALRKLAKPTRIQNQPSRVTS